MRILPDAYPDTFDECISHVLKFEGGYVNDPADPGGETKYGISKRAFPDLDIKGLTKQDAKLIYYSNYWRPVAALPAHLRFVVFDAAVNMGPIAAIKLLQDLAGVEQDGIVGPITATAAHRVTTDQYVAAREKFYRAVVKRRPASKKFLSGWLKRLRSIVSTIQKSLKKK